MEGQEKKFLTTLTFANEAASIEEVDNLVHEVIHCAHERGMTILDGNVSRSRERDPVETISYGSAEPWRNRKAEAELETPAEVPAGAPGGDVAQP